MLKISRAVKSDRVAHLFKEMMADETLDSVMVYLIFEKLQPYLPIELEMVGKDVPGWVRAKAELLKKQKTYS